MQPVKINLKNFLSYGDTEVALDNIRVAALIGSNGAGKSSLLDSLTWALYGQGRYKSIDSYVRQGQEQATVELEFLLSGETYRIIRGRSLKGKGKSTLELARLSGQTWVPISGTTIRETEQIMRDLLRMDYDTFVSSCFILQGESDRFCSAGPTERKRILGQILGLDIYDRLQEAAKIRLKAQKGRSVVLQSKIEDLEGELTNRTDVRSRKDILTSDLQGIERQITEHDVQLAELEKEKNELQIRVSKLNDLKERKTSLEREIRQIDTFLASVADKEKDADKKAKLEQQLQNILGEIKSLETDLEIAEKELGKWQIQAGRYKDLSISIQHLEKEIKKSKSQLQKLEEKRNRIQQIVNRKDEIRNKAAELDMVKIDLVEINKKAIQERELQQKFNAAEKTLSEWERQHETKVLKLESQKKEAGRKKAILEQVNCDRRDCLFLKDAFRASELFEQWSDEIAKLDTLNPPEALQSAHSELFESIRTLDYNPVKHQELRTKRESLEKWARLLPELDQAEEQLSEIETQGRNLQEVIKEKEEQKNQTKSELTRVEDARVKKSSCEAVVKQIKQKIFRERDQERGIRTELTKAQAAEEQLKELRQQAGTKRQEWKEKEGFVFTLSLEIEDVTRLSKQIKTLEHDIVSVKGKLVEARSRERKCRVELGKAEQRLSDLEQKEREKKAYSKDLKTAVREQYLCDQLVKAFGRNGIPALIVENALPSIEQEANNLLMRLTGGRMSVQLLTQRDTKAGGVSETLDILIGDELGERPYEGWSGAERFAVDISLRLAISKFLVRRAGTKIETLVIDEGASCLDYNGRQKFIEVINTISQDFKKVIVISHIEELQEAFPQQIHVIKNPEGSQVEVSI